MAKEVLILGAGFGGLELAASLSERFGDEVSVTLIDKSDTFVFGFSKLDIMFGHATPESVRIPYRRILKPGLRFLQQTVTAIDPVARRVTTDAGTFEPDILVVALGADYDFAATPGLAEAGHEFYTVAGATALRDVIAGFSSGRAVVGVCGAPYKCPPAPSEAALLLHDNLVTKGVRDRCEITLVIPFAVPIPPSPETSRALLDAFAERGIHCVADRRVASLDGARKVAVLNDGSELPFDLFLGVPVHRAPAVVEASGMTENGWIKVDRETLATKWPGVYAIGDVSFTGAPKAGVFAEGAGRAVATSIIANLAGSGTHSPYLGAGHCYIEFGAGRVGTVEIDFFSGPKPAGKFIEPSKERRADKKKFGSSREARWFGE
ncbi:MAG TPA: FAD-dependent oxidoreductase [Gemmatimonadales bacterium]|jgi:sulfide:quinone oxidoreductase